MVTISVSAFLGVISLLCFVVAIVVAILMIFFNDPDSNLPEITGLFLLLTILFLVLSGVTTLVGR